MELIWRGTASIEIRSAAGRMLFDPFVPLPGAEIKTDIEDFDGCTDIFVTHGHFDHIASIPEICGRNPGARVYCTKTPYETLVKKGVPKDSLRLISYGDVTKTRGFTVRAYHGRHAVLPKASAGRLLYMLRSPRRGNLKYIIRENRVCRENDETLVYLIEGGDRRVLLMGSLNLRDDVVYPEGCDALVLPYNGWEDNFPPAVRVVERLRPKMIYLDHCDDAFPPVTAPIDLSPVLERYAGRIEPLCAGKAIRL